MEIIHVSAECYPMAKAGGLGDVVGALPKYQFKLGHYAKVVLPMYRTKFLYENDWEVDHKGYAVVGDRRFEYTIIKERTNKLGFDLYLVDINGLLDREKIYGYDDDHIRFISFQVAVLDWINQWGHQPDIIHCHDYHAGYIPFMLKFCYGFSRLAGIRTVLTIHNAQYQGWMGWENSYLLPPYDPWRAGMLDWDDSINPLASAIKCSDRVTTVSNSYLEELRWSANGLENLFEYERGKCVGILNGIDTEVWNPTTDPFISQKYSLKSITRGKQANKKFLCQEFGLRNDLPLIVFIGRLVGEKAADILADSILSSLHTLQGNCCFLILGSGDPQVEWQLSTIQSSDRYNVVIGYNEKLSHQMYAGADFLLMPSRVEPCGLNQMYAMRYGTVPMVRSTGGLRDTVIDMDDEGGYGIRFLHATVGDVVHAVTRAAEAYSDSKKMAAMRKQMMQVDNSWDTSALRYLDIYQA